MDKIAKLALVQSDALSSNNPQEIFISNMVFFKQYSSLNNANKNFDKEKKTDDK